MKPFTDGLVLLDKPCGYTSFDILRQIRKKLGSSKIGHTGTLDKFARGLLVVLTGRFTRFASFFLGLDKEYLASVRFGTETDSLDPEGKVIDTGDIPSLEKVVSVIGKFHGEIEQVPPIYSAVHYRGERAYRLARSGEAPELIARRVRIESIEILSYVPPDLSIRVSCSKGTYIRALARDIGRSAGSCAFLTDLIRVRIGTLRLQDSVEPESFDPSRDIHPAVDFLSHLPGFETRIVKTEFISGILHGTPVNESIFESPPRMDGFFALMDKKGEVLAVVARRDGQYRYTAVFAGGA
ncbi:MAG TPA: tRNA pseudouridine(55) synthase TruB [Spirochaetia bacterium]|nr:tRNA pseudouridine(55) synthase TruB [Spirochaetia bacterium]